MKIYIYVQNTLADWEIAFVTAELYSRRFFKDKSKTVEIIKIAAASEPIKTMGGIEIKPDKTIAEAAFETGDVLILPGAETWLEPKNDEILRLAEELLDKGVVVAAICGATEAMAAKGALNERAHTSNSLVYLKMVCPNYRGEALYVDKPAVVDGNLITASGLAPIEFAYEIMKKTGMFKDESLEAWYNLFSKKEPKYFYELMNSLK